MRLQLVTSGVKFKIHAIDLSNDPVEMDCPAWAFIQSMDTASRKSITAVMKLQTDHGPIKNEQKSRLLGDGIFEFKTRQGDRVFYFYARAGTTVLTHGCKKPKRSQLPVEIEKAQRLRQLYEEAQQS